VTPRRPDSFYRKAKREGFEARSIYKLQELDRKYKILKPSQRVLDLGAAPGSWLQYASSRVGEKGFIVAVDVNALRADVASPQVEFVQSDICRIDTDRVTEKAKEYDVVLSDVAPRTTGDPAGDHERSFELSCCALTIAVSVLARGGTFVCKMYQGAHGTEFQKQMEMHFEFVKSQKPKASRSESREVFFVALNFRPGRGA